MEFAALTNRIKSTIVNRWSRIKPIFESHPTPEEQLSYRSMWKTAILAVGGVAIIPLITITMVDYQVTQKAISSEFLLRAARVVSNTQRSIGFFLDERRSALSFLVRDNDMPALLDEKRLATILANLRHSFGGGFIDLGVIDHRGRQLAYTGPFDLTDKVYTEQKWFKQVAERGVFISDVLLGYRLVPHMVIAVKNQLPDGTFYILRASVGIEPFQHLLSNLELGGHGDAFIINHNAILQTPSRYYGTFLEKSSLPVPSYSDHTEVFEMNTPRGEPLVIGYRFLKDTHFILMIVKKKAELMARWYKTRIELILFLAVSVTIILSVILCMATYMVTRIFEADQRRLAAIHHAEYANKMASIGRMSASVAHEINNPLAIINEKAGLIQDLFVYQKIYAEDAKLNGLLDGIAAAVKRAGDITKRLLAFARNLETVEIEEIDLTALIKEVLSFLGKESEHRGIKIQVNAPDGPLQTHAHRGKLQQIFLNIINNAIAAMDDGGQLEITLHGEEEGALSVDITDNGHGIPEGDVHRIFEPFFSTKTKHGGTGLGLSITYNLIQEINGQISVESELNKGTRFTVRVPTRISMREEE